MKAAEHRAAARIAWRQAGKAKGRTALVLFLVALPIASLVGTAIMITTAIATPQDEVNAQMGSADLLINGFPTTADTASATRQLLHLLPPGSTVTTTSGLQAYRIVDGSLLSLNVSEYSVPPDQPPVARQFLLEEGRMPRLPGEVALPPKIADALHSKIGDTLRLDGLKAPLLVVGLAVQRYDLRTPAVFVGPGTLPADESVANQIPLFFIDLPHGASVEAATTELGRHQIGFETRADVFRSRARDQKTLDGLAFAGVVVALFGTGLIIAAAFGVGARRQLRAHGLVEAAGGEPKHVHAIVLWTGALLGLVGSVVGIVFAIIAAYLVTPHIDSLVGRIVDAVRIPWWSIAGGIVLGTVASTLAAIGPARQAARVSAVDALSGRTPQPRAPGRLARRGLIAVVSGCVFTVIATLTREYTLLAIALVVTMSGFLLAIPLLVSFVGTWSAHLPAITRLAARQTARYGRRTGAALAAATIALTAPIALSTFIQSHDARDNNFGVALRDDQMLLSSYQPTGSGISSTVMKAARDAVPGSVVAGLQVAAQEVAPGSVVGGVGFAGQTVPDPNTDRTNDAPVFVSGPPVRAGAETADRAQIIAAGSALGVGDPTMMRVAHAEAGIELLSGDRIIAVGVPTDGGVLHLQEEHGSMDVPAVSIPGGDPALDLPVYFIPEHLMARYKLHASVATQAVLRAPHKLTGNDVARVKHAVSLIPGASAQWQRDSMIDSTVPRLLISGAATLLGLIIVAVSVALTSAESRREQAILSAVGAAPNVRRRMAGANALLMAGLAAFLAIPAGLIPVTLILNTQKPSYPVSMPWSVIAVVCIGAPVLAWLFAAALSRAPKAKSLLQPNW